jgi:hypothetical protein
MNHEAFNDDDHLVSRCSGVKTLLKRLNLSYTERQDGNAVIIEIKAKNPQIQPLPVRSGPGLEAASFSWPQE